MAAAQHDSTGFAPPAPRTAPEGEADAHPLLSPLADAQDTLARLEATLATASAAAAEGLRARTAYREAAGWLAHSHTWVHPRDLALRDAGLTGSYTAADLAGRLAAELPTMTAHGSEPDVVPADEMTRADPRRARRPRLDQPPWSR